MHLYFKLIIVINKEYSYSNSKMMKKMSAKGGKFYVSANHHRPFRQTEKDAKIYSQQKSERSCEYYVTVTVNFSIII